MLFILVFHRCDEKCFPMLKFRSFLLSSLKENIDLNISHLHGYCQCNFDCFLTYSMEFFLLKRVFRIAQCHVA